MIEIARNLTPQRFARTLAPGAVDEINAYGRYVLIGSITASTIQLSLEDDPYRQVDAGERIDCEEFRFVHLSLRNAGAVASTVVLYVSIVKVDLESLGGLLATIAASLASIDQEISGAAVCNQVAAVNVPITGGAGVQLFAANPARTLVSLSCPDTNGGIVYLGNAAGNVSAVDFMDLIYPGGNWYDERYKGAVFAVGNDALEWVGGYEE